MSGVSTVSGALHNSSWLVILVCTRVLAVEHSGSHDTNGSWRSRWQFGMAPVETVGRT